MDDAIALKALESVADQAVRMVGSGIEMFGVLIIVAGIAWSTYLHLRRPMPGEDSEIYKIRIGRSLLLGLEVLVAADIVKTIAHELSFVSLGLLAGLVLVRTFLGWTLVLEIDGRWPWQRRAVAHVFESSDRRNGRHTLTTRELRSDRHNSCHESVERSG
jgi:uncharacterized membrane protein